MAVEFDEFFRVDRLPTVFCPGCGIGVVMTCFFRAFNNVGLDLKNTVFTGGIGCSSRIPMYINGDMLHTTHGRAIPFATGLKLANPKLKVVIFAGDGDIGAIGGNHLINGCRRNVDLTVICINNNTYGMTGGQMSTTTPHGYLSTTSPEGNLEYPFDLSKLAAAAGANYVARWTVRHVHELVKSMEKALQKRGFTFVEAVSTCPTGFGRRNKMGDPAQQLEWLKSISVRNDRIQEEDGERLDLNLQGLISVGEFVDRDRTPLTDLIYGKKEAGKRRI
jgi:2-oxoglutarate ferredoxin oxidoreductase subunit beta